MLVTMATNKTIALNSSETFTYSPNSVQKVIINIADADWEDCSVTVQIGSRTICNSVKLYGLSGMTGLLCNTAFDTGATVGFCLLDFGSHQCMNNDNLYVTIAAVAEATATDVSAIVDEPFAGSMPLKYTVYSDSTFTSENNLMGVCWDAAEAGISTDNYNCEVKTSLYSSNPTFISSNDYYKSKTLTARDNLDKFGLLNSHSVPLRTTYNYNGSAVTDTICTIEAMGSSPGQVQKAKRSAAIARTAVGR